MDSQYTVRMYDEAGNCVIESICFYFRYVKELYTPYVWFEGKFISSVTAPASDILRIEFWIYGKMMHRGLADSIDICREGNRNIITVKSKSFTSLLCQNQPEPGMITDVNLSKIIGTYPDIPYVTCEDSENENYIYVKDGATVWDAVCNFGFRKTGLYPYIEGTNNVRITQRNPSINHVVNNNNILGSGVCHDCTRIISHIHMQDINGDYDVYSKSNAEAMRRGIIRHKQIPLDRQFLNNPDSGLSFKLNYSMRGMVCNYIKYVGYNYEDLFDEVTYGSFTKKKIHRIEVVFNGGMPITVLGTYNDGFFGDQ